MRIAIVFTKVSRDNAIGSCLLDVIAALAPRHDLTVFAIRFDGPVGGNVRFVKVPAALRPLPLVFLTFHLSASLVFLYHRLIRGERFDRVIAVESEFCFADMLYSHFCHRWYLGHNWRNSGGTGLRALSAWMNLRLHAMFEPTVYRRAREVVVPSRGLKRELTAAYPVTSGKVRVLPNSVDLDRMTKPREFDREKFRLGLGLDGADVVVLFVALGHFERKGLPLLMEAMSTLDLPRLRLLVVGGQPGLVSDYRERAGRLGLNDRVRFAGTQRDVRPYFWAADGFALPSWYEVFPLVALEAAAAGLPSLLSQLNGVEEFLKDGENGLLVDRTPGGVAAGLARLSSMSPRVRAEMGARARASVLPYSVAKFREAWRDVIEPPGAERSPAALSPVEPVNN